MKKILSMLFMQGVYFAMIVQSVTAVDNLPPSGERISVNVNESGSDYSVKWNKDGNRIMVTSDFIEDYFDADVKAYDNSIDIYSNNHILHFENGNEFYIMDNIGGRKIDCPPTVYNGKSYLPLRYVCEAFGASINYDINTGTAEVALNSLVLDKDTEKYFENVSVFDQSSIRITGEKTVYIDPRRILGEPHDADIVFITHTHNDHYDVESIRRIMKPSTVIYITQDGVEQAKNDGFVNVEGVVPNMDYEINGIKFSTIAAYNTDESRQNHKREFNWVGYIITINGYTYYAAGDTDFTVDMKSIKNKIDVAFLPIDGKYNMGAEEAADAANAIMPRIAVPYHYNNFVPESRAEDFIRLLDENIKGAVATFKMR